MTPRRRPRTPRSETGSALVMAVFVLALVTTTGVALLFLTQTETLTTRSDAGAKRVYYYSEAGLEDGRTTLWIRNRASADPTTLTDDLTLLAGPDGAFDFNLAALVPAFDDAGRLTGLSGYGDDLPVRPRTGFDQGFYAAFVTNDPVEGETTVVDDNDRVMITGVAGGPDRSLEITQAIVVRRDFFPEIPATITILGQPDCVTDCAVFDGGTSTAKEYKGDDSGAHCPKGTGESHPVVGVVGDLSVLTAQDGVFKTVSYTSGTETGIDTVQDLTDDADTDPMWTDCEALVEFAEVARDSADVLGTTSSPNTILGTAANPKVVFITGDYSVLGGVKGAGVLFVTGRLTFDGRAEWTGPVFVIGKGDFTRDGSGNGAMTGGIVIADVAGPDRILFTDDDCSGDDGLDGTSDDGIAQGTYDTRGAGTGLTGYCSSDVFPFLSKRPLQITSFAQR